VHQNFSKSGFGNHGNKLLDIVATKIAIRGNLEEREKVSVGYFGFWRFGDKVLSHQIRESEKFDLPKHKGGISQS
jgi:hypothetical protein